MKESLATLMLDIKILGLEPKNISFEFITSTINQLDLITLKYLSDDKFLEVKYPYIFSSLKKQLKTYKLQITPTHFILGKNKVYILKDGRKIQPLFQTIKLKNTVYGIEFLTKKRMYAGNLKILYECDKIMQFQNPDYKSLFIGISPILLAKLEADLLKEEIPIFFNHLKNKCCYEKLLRLMLMTGTYEEIKEKYLVEIENLHLNEYPKIQQVMTRKICRLPYKDN